MAIQPDDLRQRHLSQVVARARAGAAAAGELTPIPSINDDLEAVDPEAREAFLELFRPGGAYWEASAAVAASDPDLA